MRFVLLLLALVVFGAPAAYAQDGSDTPPDVDFPSDGVACTDQYADWQAGDVASSANRAVPTGTIETPPGTHTQIFACVVAGHTVRMNFANWPVETYHCGATDDSRVSVWVDGDRVVDDRSLGDYDNCMGGSEPEDNLRVWRVLVNNRMHLTVCDRLIDSDQDTPHEASDLKPGQTDEPGLDHYEGTPVHFISQCTLTDLSGHTAGADPYFDGKTIKRTPPGIELVENKDDVCAALTPAMTAQTDPRLASALDAHLVSHTTLDGKDFATAPQDQQDAGGIAVYRLDVDGDGVDDTVTVSDRGTWDPDSGLDFPPQSAWKSGKSGTEYPLTGTRLNTGIEWTSKLYDDPVRDDLSFISAGGHVYLYRADVGYISSFINFHAPELETIAGAVDGDPEPTRHLYRLSPDGTATEICGWAARKRPEEFL